MKYVVLDSTPLGLLVHRAGHPEAEACREWLGGHLAKGTKFLIPEIVDYELRRELVRLMRRRSISLLDGLHDRAEFHVVPLTTPALRLAAELWATSRQQGQPTADVHSLDIDVILAAQVLTAGLPEGEFVVATSNVRHLSQFVAAGLWSAVT